MELKSGYAGKILRVDLTSGTCVADQIPEEDLRLYAGGRGLGIKLLYDEVPVGASPLSPDNRIIFLSGPLTRRIKGSRRSENRPITTNRMVTSIEGVNRSSPNDENIRAWLSALNLITQSFQRCWTMSTPFLKLRSQV